MTVLTDGDGIGGSAYALGMSSDFALLIADIEREARDEGPRAVRELERFHEEFGLAGEAIVARCRLGNNLGNKLSETREHSEARTPANTGSIN